MGEGGGASWLRSWGPALGGQPEQAAGAARELRARAAATPHSPMLTPLRGSAGVAGRACGLSSGPQGPAAEPSKLGAWRVYLGGVDQREQGQRAAIAFQCIRPVHAVPRSRRSRLG